MTSRSGGLVLFLDDEPDIVEAFQVALGMMGYACAGFTAPERALERFSADPAAVLAIVTDYTMPQMPCADFIGKLRGIRADVLIHLCTGNAPHEIEGFARQHAVRSVLYKPFDYATLEAFMATLGGREG